MTVDWDSLRNLFGAGEWQTVLLYVFAGTFLGVLIVRWQNADKPPWCDFHIVGLIANKIDGNWRIDHAKFMAVGAFIISSIGVVACVIRGKVPGEFVGLLTIYGGVYVLGNFGERKVKTNAEVEVMRAEINRGRRGDVSEDETVEEQEQRERTTQRRRKSDKLLG